MQLSPKQLASLNGAMVLKSGDDVVERLGKIEQAIAALPKPVAPEKMDIGPMRASLGEISSAIAALPKAEAADMSQVHDCLSRIEVSLAAIATKKVPPVYTFDVQRNKDGISVVVATPEILQPAVTGRLS